MITTGYADRLSVARGETIRFMVSTPAERFRTDLVRLIHGDPNPAGPGFKEEEIPSTLTGEHEGAVQPIHAGSYAVVPDAPALRLTGSFTILAWIMPTLPEAGPQGIVSKWNDAERLGFALMLDEGGALTLMLGGRSGTVRLSTGAGLRRGEWAFVAASYDADRGHVLLVQEPRELWPDDPARTTLERSAPAHATGEAASPLIIAGWSRDGGGDPKNVGGHFWGKIEAPAIHSHALSLEEMLADRDHLPLGAARDLVAGWDFAQDIASARISDRSPNGLHGRVVNMPMRAVTGRNWTGLETDWRHAPEQYGAIHFTADDLEDCGWELNASFVVPDDLPSAVYAARVRAGEDDDHIPFVVRPTVGAPSAPVLVLLPTFTYLAYANEHGEGPTEGPQIRLPRAVVHGDAELSYMTDNRLLSMYDRRRDGSGVAFSSRLRPILNFRPQHHAPHIDGPHALSADLCLIDWLTREAIAHDVATDEDLHADGCPLLNPYKVVITGSHPEYWSGQMLDAVNEYLHDGGRVMYLGGNGMYWVTSVDPERPHVIEIRRWGGTEAWKAEPGERHHAGTGELGGLWRFRGRDPRKMFGVGFAAQGFDTAATYTRGPDSRDPRVASFFDGIGDDEPIGDCANLILGYGAAGHEVDRVDRTLGTPAHTLILATASGAFSDSYQAVLEDQFMADAMSGGTVSPLVRSDIVYVEYPRGGAVFSVGSIAWVGALHGNDYQNTVARLTGNVLRRFMTAE